MVARKFPAFQFFFPSEPFFRRKMALGRAVFFPDIFSLKIPNLVYVFRLDISKPKHFNIFFHDSAMVLMVSLPLTSKIDAQTSLDWV